MLETSKRIRKMLPPSGIKPDWGKCICIDIDGVICEYDFPKMVKSFFGVDLTPTMIFAYDLADVLGVSSTLINQMFKEQVYGKPNLVDGALITLKQWESGGYILDIFSNRARYMGKEGLTKWLIKWKIPFNEVGNGQGNYDVHIDDMASKLMTTDSDLKLLFNQPWNQRCLNITGNLIRVNSWQEIRERVNGE